MRRGEAVKVLIDPNAISPELEADAVVESSTAAAR
jgi:hypothetical protein